MSLRGAILGFLSIEPTTGYTLKQRFDGSVGSFWTATRSQIYRELTQLEEQGLVELRREASPLGPDRHVHSLTDPGREALERWLREPLDPLVIRHPLLLRFVFAAHLPGVDLDRMLSDYAEGVVATRADYAARLGDERIFALARSAREATLWRLSIEHGLAWCDAELGWIAAARAALEAP